jgi:serralysin
MRFHTWMCGCPGCAGKSFDDGNDSPSFAGTSSGSVAYAAKPVYTPAQIAYQVQTSWGGAFEGAYEKWAATTIYYSIPTTAPLGRYGEATGFTQMTPYMQAQAAQAFELWDDLIAVNLVQIASPNAHITLAHSSRTLNNGTYADPWLSGASPNYTITHDAIWINSTWTSNKTDAGFLYGNYGFLTYVHEIGHSLGLSHAGSYNAAPGVTFSYANNAEFAQDTHQYTVMSYFDAYNYQNRDHYGSDNAWKVPSTPMLYDILAIQQKYGADMTTRTGDTVYGFGSNAGKAVFDFSKNPNPVITIWDAGGTDTLNCSGFSQNQVINLIPGTYSSVGALQENVAIAFGCNIENAVGGSGHDTIYGTNLNNVLTGNAGNDWLFGYGGNDTFVGGAGNDNMAGGAGNDTYYVDSLSDVVKELANEGTDIVYAMVNNYTLGANVENGQVWSTSGLTLTGNALANTIWGYTGNDFLIGGAANDQLLGQNGNDRLDGGAGNDAMWGGLGDDIYHIDSLSDVVNEGANQGTDWAGVFVSGHTLAANVENGVVWTSAGVALTGNTMNNILYGGASGDALNGGAGADTLYGQGSNDWFVFNRGQANGDVVGDFQGNGTAAGDQLRFVGYGPGASLRRIDSTHVQVNSGDGLVHEIITLSNAASLAAGDYVFL